MKGCQTERVKFAVVQVADTLCIPCGFYSRSRQIQGQLDDASQISHAEVPLLDHSGHMGFMEEADKVLTRLKQFLI